MPLRIGWIVRLGMCAAGLCAGTVAVAAPGDTAAMMISKLGPPSNDYRLPPQPTAEDLKAGRDKLATVYWLNATYDPLQVDSSLRGNLIITFKYSVGSTSRIPTRFEWRDLTSYSEVFLARIDSAQWEDLRVRLREDWVMQSQQERSEQGNAFQLMTLMSRDGQSQMQISYSPHVDAAAGRQPHTSAPAFNFWSRIAPVNDPDWRSAVKAF